MKLSESADLCDAIELGALANGKIFSQQQILRQFFPGSKDAKHVELVRDAIDLAFRRKRACGNEDYPFRVEPRSIQAEPVTAFRIYHFLLFGRALNFGGPPQRDVLLRNFRNILRMFCAGHYGELVLQPTCLVSLANHEVYISNWLTRFKSSETVSENVRL